MNKMVEDGVQEQFGQYLEKVKHFKAESKAKVAELENEMAAVGQELEERE